MRRQFTDLIAGRDSTLVNVGPQLKLRSTPLRQSWQFSTFTSPLEKTAQVSSLEGAER